MNQIALLVWKRQNIYLKSNNKPIFNTPYSINNERFKDIKHDKSNDHEKIIFLSSGSLIHRKGYDLAIQAFNLLDDQLKSKIEYWILGDGILVMNITFFLSIISKVYELNNQ